MNDGERDLIKKAFRDLMPPTVSEDEWRGTWEGTVRSARFGAARTAPVLVNRIRWLAYAATFVVGLGLGVFAGRMGVNGNAISPGIGNVNSIEHIASIEPATSGTLPKEESKGLEICGLRNVEIETLPPTEESGKLYRMTAVAPSGARVVWTYPPLGETARTRKGEI